VLEDHLRRVSELDAASLQRLVGGVDVGNAEVEDGVVLEAGDFDAVVLFEEEARAAAIEEGELAVGVHVRQAEDVFVERLRPRDALHGARDLTDRPEA
jgi:hypothetical protein